MESWKVESKRYFILVFCLLDEWRCCKFPREREWKSQPASSHCRYWKIRFLWGFLQFCTFGIYLMKRLLLLFGLKALNWSNCDLLIKNQLFSFVFCEREWTTRCKRWVFLFFLLFFHQFRSKQLESFGLGVFATAASWHSRRRNRRAPGVVRIHLRLWRAATCSFCCFKGQQSASRGSYRSSRV